MTVERSEAARAASSRNLAKARAALLEPRHAWTRSQRTSKGNRRRRWMVAEWAVSKLERDGGND